MYTNQNMTEAQWLELGLSFRDTPNIEDAKTIVDNMHTCGNVDHSCTLLALAATRNDEVECYIAEVAANDSLLASLILGKIENTTLARKIARHRTPSFLNNVQFSVDVIISDLVSNRFYRKNPKEQESAYLYWLATAPKNEVFELMNEIRAWANDPKRKLGVL